MQIETIAAARPFQGIERFSVRSEDRITPANTLARRTRDPALRLIVVLGAVLGAAGMTAELLSRHADARSVEVLAPTSPARTAGAAPWIEVNRPIHLFELAGSEFGKLPSTYRARRRAQGDERQDFLTYGGLGPDMPFLDLAILRRPLDNAAQNDIFVDLARLAAEAGVSVVRSGFPTVVPTRFGPFATNDLMLARGETPFACLGFRLEADGATPAAVGIAGFACGTAERAVDRTMLACVLDRIDLVSAGDDEALRSFFVAAERRRGQECVGSHLLAAGSRNSWLDASRAAPALKSWTSGPARR